MTEWEDTLAKLEQLQKRLGGKAADWHVGKWNPGDGWTRYRLEHNGAKLCEYMTKKEFIAFVAGMLTLERWKMGLVTR